MALIAIDKHDTQACIMRHHHGFFSKPNCNCMTAKLRQTFEHKSQGCLRDAAHGHGVNLATALSRCS